MFTTKSTKSIIQLTFLVALFGLFAGYTYLNAAWSNPTALPPNNNVEAPINVSGADQYKAGNLQLNSLAVWGNTTITGLTTVYGALPILKFQETDALDYWIATNANNFYIFADRNDNGAWEGGDGMSPLQLTAHPTESIYDYALFSSAVRAISYCDQAGGNCFTAAEVKENGGGGTANEGQVFGGMFSLGSSLACDKANPLTSACSCPTGFNQEIVSDSISGGSQYIYYCMKSSGSTVILNQTQIKNTVVTNFPSVSSAEQIHNGTVARASVCNLALAGSTPYDYESSSFTSPGDNSVARLATANWNSWTVQYPATSYNSFLTSLTCKAGY